jgi:hypothetical protein
MKLLRFTILVAALVFSLGSGSRSSGSSGGGGGGGGGGGSYSQNLGPQRGPWFCHRAVKDTLDLVMCQRSIEGCNAFRNSLMESGGWQLDQCGTSNMATCFVDQKNLEFCTYDMNQCQILAQGIGAATQCMTIYAQ